MADPGTLGDVPLMPFERAPARKRPDTTPADETDTREPESSDLEQDAADEADTDNAEVEGAEADDKGEEQTEEEVAAEPAEASFEIDGQSVTLSEIRDSWMRQADYTRKTQELAEQRRSLQTETETERTQLRQQRDTYADRLRQLEEAAAGNATQPDWDELAKADPARFQQEFAAWQKRAQQVAAVRAERERVEQERFTDFQQQRQQRLVEEGTKLLEAVPEWADQTRRDADHARLREFAVGTYQFTADELNEVADHRLVLLLRDAMAYRELRAKGDSLIADKTKGIKVLKPGPRDTRGAQQKDAAAIGVLRRKLRQSGSEEDFLRLLEGQREAREAAARRRSG